jgi:hypothetical protein
MDSRCRPAFNDRRQRPAMCVIKQRRLTGSLAVDQALRAASVELYHAVADNLQRHAANLGRRCPAGVVIDRSQSEEPVDLSRILALACRQANARGVKIKSQAGGHGEDPPSAILESHKTASRESPRESQSPRLGRSVPIAPSGSAPGMQPSGWNTRPERRFTIAKNSVYLETALNVRIIILMLSFLVKLE